MDYNALAQEIIAELKDDHARRTDADIAHRLGISRQAYVRRRDHNALTTDDITVLSAWLITEFGGGWYLDKYLMPEEASCMTNPNPSTTSDSEAEELDRILDIWPNDTKKDKLLNAMIYKERAEALALKAAILEWHQSSLAQAEIKGAIAEVDRMAMIALKLLNDHGGISMDTQAFIDDCNNQQSKLEARLEAADGGEK